MSSLGNGHKVNDRPLRQINGFVDHKVPCPYGCSQCVRHADRIARRGRGSPAWTDHVSLALGVAGIAGGYQIRRHEAGAPREARCRARRPACATLPRSSRGSNRRRRRWFQCPAGPGNRACFRTPPRGHCRGRRPEGQSVEGARPPPCPWLLRARWRAGLCVGTSRSRSAGPVLGHRAYVVLVPSCGPSRD